MPLVGIYYSARGVGVSDPETWLPAFNNHDPDTPGLQLDDYLVQPNAAAAASTTVGDLTNFIQLAGSLQSVSDNLRLSAPAGAGGLFPHAVPGRSGVGLLPALLAHFAGNLTAATTTSSALSTLIQLAATPSAASTTTGGFTNFIRLAATLSAASTTTGGFTNFIQLAATPAAVTTTVGALTTAGSVALLSASVGAASTTTGSFTNFIRLAGSLSGSAVTSGWVPDLIGGVIASVTATSDLYTGFHGNLQAVSTVTPSLNTQILMVGNPTAATTVLADSIHPTRQIAAAIAAQSTTSTPLLSVPGRAGSTLQPHGVPGHKFKTTAGASALMFSNAGASTTLTGVLSSPVSLGGSLSAVSSASLFIGAIAELRGSGMLPHAVPGRGHTQASLAAALAAAVTTHADLTTSPFVLSGNLVAGATATAALSTTGLSNVAGDGGDVNFSPALAVGVGIGGTNITVSASANSATASIHSTTESGVCTVAVSGLPAVGGIGFVSVTGVGQSVTAGSFTVRTTQGVVRLDGTALPSGFSATSTVTNISFAPFSVAVNLSTNSAVSSLRSVEIDQLLNAGVLTSFTSLSNVLIFTEVNLVPIPISAATSLNSAIVWQAPPQGPTEVWSPTPSSPTEQWTVVKPKKAKAWAPA